VTVSAPIVARDGSTVRPLSAPEGTRYMALFTYAPGRPLNWNNEEHCFLAGRLLGRLHEAADSFVSARSRPRIDIEYLVDTPSETLRPFLLRNDEDRKRFTRFVAHARARAVQALSRDVDCGPCHGDYSSTNIHVTSEGLMTAFDFDLCGWGPRVYDFIDVYRVAALTGMVPKWNSFLQGYLTIRTLTADDTALVPILHVLNCVWSAGHAASSITRWGTQTVYEDRFDFRYLDLDDPDSQMKWPDTPLERVANEIRPKTSS